MNLKANGWWTEWTGRRHSSIMGIVKIPMLDMPMDQVRPELMMDDKFECMIPIKEERPCEDRLYPPDDGILCYTDVSKRRGLSGAGLYCECLQLEDGYPQENMSMRSRKFARQSGKL